MKIEYVEKKKLYPAFGRAYPNNQLILIRKDLPNAVQNFVLEHELYHLKDKTRLWIWREIKANWVGMLKHPIGFLWCCVLSLSPARLWFYVQRFIKGY